MIFLNQFFWQMTLGRMNLWKKNKSIEYEKRERLWEKTAYVSANGLNYIKLYRKTYDQYLKRQYS